MRQMTEDEFDDTITLIPNHITGEQDSTQFETYGEELDYVISMVRENRVITVIESDDNMVYSTGYHLVNRLHYLITTEPLTEDFEVNIIF